MAVAFFAWGLSVAIAGRQDTSSGRLADHPAIRYASAPAQDPVTLLQQQISAGSVRLSADGPSGYLRSLLDALNVPVSSQIMVFSKGSVQSGIINAQNPRAIFFNDEVAVAWVRGGYIEIASQDPQQGVVFYALGPPSPGPGTPPLQRRDSECLRCHESLLTEGVPGMRVGSDHRRPLERRWGGWYVTGSLGSTQHYGNVDLQRPDAAAAAPFNWPSLEGKLDVTGYLSPYSDVAALMVFDHQMHLMNLLTRIGWDVRVAEREGGLNRQAPWLRDRAAEIADYMLFVDEAPFASPVQSTSGFAAAFSAAGPRDRRGRSLRELDLSKRLLRYPCSYLIYSRQFEQMPEAARAAIYERLWAILSGADRGTKYRRLTASDRRAIGEILHDTKKDLPAYFAATTARP